MSLNVQEYRIQPLDILSVTFETLSDENDAFDFLSKLAIQQGRTGGANAAANGIVVNTEGFIEFAVLGDIKVAGLTVFEAQDTIKAVASKFIPDVIVRVRMLNFRFTVLGEVNGEKTVISPTTRLTMMEAIGQAGGLGELADRSRVKVIRQNGNEAEIFYVNLLEEDYLESPYYYVQQNDVIIVPPLKQRTFRSYFTSNLGIITTTISFVLLIYTLAQYVNSTNNIPELQDITALKENPKGLQINFKRVADRVIRLWYVVVISVLVALAIAYIINRYTHRIYPIKASIIIKENDENAGAKFLYNNALLNPYRNFLNEIYIMKSYPLLQEVMESLGFEVSMYREGEIQTSEFYNPDFPVKFHVLPKGARPVGKSMYFRIKDEQTFSLQYVSPEKEEGKAFRSLDF